MRRVLLSAAAALIPLALFVPEAQGAKIVELYKAYSRNYVRVSAESKTGASSVKLRIVNRTKDRLLIDPAGSYLIPHRGRVQRLGLGPPVVTRTSQRPAFIPLAPRGTWEGVVRSCCMDEGRSGPGNGTAYRVAGGAAPRRIYKALQLWGFHPGLSQAEVQKVVWGKMHLRRLQQKIPHRPPVNVKFLADGGRLFWLDGSGDLHLCEVEGAHWRRIAVSVQDFAVGFGWLTAFDPRTRTLRVYNDTERRWEVWTLPEKPRSVHPAPGRVLYVVGEKGALWVRRPGTASFQTLAPSDVTGFAVAARPVSSAAYALTRKGKISVGRADPASWESVTSARMKEIGSSDRLLYARGYWGIYCHRGKWRRIASPRCRVFPSRGGCFLLHKSELSRYDEEEDRTTSLGRVPGDIRTATVDRTSGAFYVLNTEGQIWRLSGPQWFRVDLPAVKDPAERGK
jgi:hypothetical protein